MKHNEIMDIMNNMIIEIDNALLKAKEQMLQSEISLVKAMEKRDELIRLGFEEDDTISGDMNRDE